MTDTVTQSSGILRPVGSIHSILPSGRQDTSLKHVTGMETLALNGMVLGLSIGSLAFSDLPVTQMRKTDVCVLGPTLNDRTEGFTRASPS